MPVPFEGGCRCGAIRYRCAAEPVLALHCHCRDCQYASGGACSSVVLVLTDAVAVDGAPAAFTSRADSGTEVSRLFCRVCGSPLFAKTAAGAPLMAIKIASLDDPSRIEPSAHIWIKSEVRWAALGRDLATFAGNFGET